MNQSAAITFRDVEKAYGSHRALTGLNISFAKGKVTALLGPNGAGKTTAVSLLLQLAKPTAGTVEIDGLPPGHSELKERIGAMLQETAAPDGLTVKETLQLFRSYYRKPLPLERLLEIAGLEKEQKKRAASLSGGQKRRLAFATALAGDPDIIVLDEPSVGMDVESRRRFWEVVRALARSGRTILLTTHYLEEADAVADQIVVIAKGRLVAEGSPEELKTASFKARLVPSEEELRMLPGVEEAFVLGSLVQLKTTDTDSLLGLLLQTGWGVSDIRIQTASLESIFRQLTETDSTFEGSSRS